MPSKPVDIRRMNPRRCLDRLLEPRQLGRLPDFHFAGKRRRVVLDGSWLALPVGPKKDGGGPEKGDYQDDSEKFQNRTPKR